MILYRAFLFLALALVLSVPAVAQQEEEATPDQFIYEKPTLEKLSQLYWALSKLDIFNDAHIDNFLMINECDIYQQYFQNEFEWQQVREAGRDFITQSKKLFPVRFEVVQPLFLEEYDFQRGAFEIQDKYKIKGVRRFEIKSEDFGDVTCGVQIRDIVGYPRGVIVEFSRPVSMEYLPTDAEKAKQYLETKMAPYNALSEEERRKVDIYRYRDAYMVMKMQFFAYKQDVVQESRNYAQLLGVLEAVEVYADADRKQLLFSEVFRRRRNISSMERQLRETYEAKKMEERKQQKEKAAGTVPASPAPAPATPPQASPPSAPAQGGESGAANPAPEFEEEVIR